MEDLNKDDFCGHCGYKGSDTWVVTKREDIDGECDCEEHTECRNCGVPL